MKRKRKHGNGFGKPQLNRSDTTAEESKIGNVVIVDKFTGECRSGGMELFDAFQEQISREREAFGRSNNPHYLVGTVQQNSGTFQNDEIISMIDAVFMLAYHNSPDVWYPNQYALSIAFSADETIGSEIAYFLSNFELGLRISADRALRQKNEGHWSCESEQLAKRLDNPDGLVGLSFDDLIHIRAHVREHPIFNSAMHYYRYNSGRKMNGAVQLKGA